jgi:hypothetical protein
VKWHREKKSLQCSKKCEAEKNSTGATSPSFVLNSLKLALQRSAIDEILGRLEASVDAEEISRVSSLTPRQAEMLALWFRLHRVQARKLPDL